MALNILLFRSPFEFSDITDGYIAFLKRLSVNHKTKQTLCLVSKRWRAIVYELIFEYLFLQDSFDWDKLASGLEASESDGEARGGHGAGWYVRRLEILTLAWTPERGAAAARVIRCCPNLRILTVGAIEEACGIPPEILDAVFEACPRGLRSLDWTCDIGAGQTERMLRLLPRAKGLRSLFMCVQRPLDPKEDLEVLKNVELQQLHTVELVSADHDPSDMLDLMSHWSLPGLRQVVLCGQTGLREGTEFFTAHGPRIHTLEFDQIGTKCGEVLTLCPELRELVVNMAYAHSQVDRGHPKVQRVGLRGLNVVERGFQEQTFVINALKQTFPLFLDRKRFPAVKLVRLLDFDGSKFKSIKWRATDIAFWAFWTKRFERMAVRLEDHEGKLITIKFSEVNILLPEDLMVNGTYMRGGARWRIQ